MTIQIELLQVGLAVVVQGSVRVKSADGVIKVIEPNAQIFLDDHIDTGSGGAVSIVWNDSAAGQLDLGRMSSTIIDEDVAGGTLPDLGDVAVEAGQVADLWQNWESFEPIAALDTLVADTDESGAQESAAADSIEGMDAPLATVAESDSGDDGLGSIDDDLDMTNLIPPPEDAS